MSPNQERRLTDHYANCDIYYIITVLGNTKLLIVGGYTSSGLTSNLEVIDLEIFTSECSGIPNYPVAQDQSVGALSSTGPLVCGGIPVTQDCYDLENGVWKKSTPLNEAKFGSAICPSFVMDDFQFIVTGGYTVSAGVSTTEVLTNEGWKTSLPDLPETAFGHCMVKVNSTTIFAILRSSTYFMSSTDKKWVLGPKMNMGRIYAGCAMIKRNSTSHEKSVIVVGGSSYWSSVEILDVGASQWRNGPNLRFGIDHSELVEDHLGGVILVGGSSKNVGYLDTLFRLPHAGDEAQWTELPQKLKLARCVHSAFLIPDSYVNCSLP